MSKLLKTLFLVLLLGFIGGVIYLSFMDVPVKQETVTHTVTLEEYRAKQAP